MLALQVWWQCQRYESHAWAAIVKNRARANSRCPFCMGRRADALTSLSAVRPDLAAQWDTVKNGALTPHIVRAFSCTVVHWKCSAGPDHEWATQVRRRAYAEHITSCPFCANRRASITNCLETVAPLVAGAFDAARNAPLTPRDVVAATTKRVYFAVDGGRAVRESVRVRVAAFRARVAAGMDPARAAALPNHARWDES